MKNIKPEMKEDRRWCLVTTAGFVVAWRPVDDDKAETHYHEQKAYPSKTSSLEEEEEDHCRYLAASFLSQLLL